MKKQTLLFFLLSTIAFQVAQAQPTLTAANTNFQAAERYIIKQTQYVNPGPGGANQVWDFSSNLVVRPDSINQVIDNTSGSFPFLQANILVWDGFFSNTSVFNYFQITGSNKQRVGYNQNNPFGGSLETVYTNLEELLRYPFTYQNSFTDVFKGTQSSSQPNNTFTNTFTGTTTVDADGYGTLITPTGTYTNTLRVKTSTLRTDSSSTGKSVYLNEIYEWYQPGIHWPIFQLHKNTDASGNIVYSSFGRFLKRVIVSTPDELTATLNLQLYPNPTSEKALLTYELKKPAEVKIALLNLMGQEVKQIKDGNEAAGLQQTAIQLTGLSTGMYLVKVQVDDAVLMKR
ncbi:MAG: T9SS type A sorting domain-containing protein, partial [Hymenobacteraceae bacterium]|nr:T9SS type A sorting domain-containing protein [Hymenobacteraceae bacterium]